MVAALEVGADPRRSDRWFATRPSYGSAAYGRSPYGERSGQIVCASVAGEIDAQTAARLMAS